MTDQSPIRTEIDTTKGADLPIKYESFLVKHESAPINAGDDTPKSKCDAISELALQIMSGRQKGVSMSKMMHIAEQNKLTQALIIAAYEINRFSTEEYQTRVIEEFRDDAHLQCVKALHK
ncbi:MAG: hypothetical protein PHH59_10455 [Methylovulum sp.]|uniref:hypothetical protein n=1 Tax=Methylovulum sp. TaxID=1916980 RepID=UPI002632F307|nr:hypothetical protein [Methylovulum sp.]MDD2724427.1 hypothetical protein [Methylovulum sp.]MDD5123988.1 hypothetical protein [Methylovulum sp.]